MRLTVFYSWQSDRPGKLCRHFIEIALQDAADRLSDRRSVEVVVDSDTKNVPGTPPITAVILEKIEACDVFVADVTFVGETAEPTEDGAPKRLPNPNVMGEFGYALAKKSWRRVLLAMNEAYGPAKDLPFDLGHFRKPATYTVATERPDTARRAARNRLSAQLEINLEAVLDDILKTAPSAPDLREPLTTLWLGAQNGRITSHPPCLVSQPSAYVYLVPAAALDAPRLTPSAIETHRHFLAPADAADARAGQDNTQWWAHGPTRRVGDLPNPEATWCGRLLRPGIVEQLFTLGVGEPEDEGLVRIDGAALERRLIETVDRALALLGALGLDGPTLVALSLYDLDKVRLGAAAGDGAFNQLSFGAPPVLLPAGAARSGDHLRDTFDRLWLAGGVPAGSPSFTGETWAGYGSSDAAPSTSS